MVCSGTVVLGSEQHLIDCDRKYDHGCSGGGWLNAIQYTIKNKGLATEQQYPYTGKDGHCNKMLARQRYVEGALLRLPQMPLLLVYYIFVVQWSTTVL